MSENAHRNHFLNLFSIAIADSNIDPKELDYLYQLGIKRGFTKEQIDNILANPHKVRFIKPSSIFDAIEQLYDLIGMVLSDGVIHPYEVDLCRTFAKKFEIKNEIIDELIETLIEETKAGVGREELIYSIKQSL